MFRILLERRMFVSVSFPFVEVMFIWDADLVVASTGEDKKISLWRKNGQSLGTVPVTGKDGGDSAEVYSFLE